MQKGTLDFMDTRSVIVLLILVAIFVVPIVYGQAITLDSSLYATYAEAEQDLETVAGERITAFNADFDSYDIPQTAIDLYGNDVVQAKINLTNQALIDPVLGEAVILLDLVLQDGRVADWTIGSTSHIQNTTLWIETDEAVIQSIVNSDSPISVAQQAVRDGRIKITSANPINNLLIGMADILSRLLPSDSDAARIANLQPLEQVSLSNGDILAANTFGVRYYLQEAANADLEPATRVIDRYGNTIGWTTPDIMNMINERPDRYSENAGIYSNPNDIV